MLTWQDIYFIFLLSYVIRVLFIAPLLTWLVHITAHTVCTFRAPKEDGHTYKKSNKLARDSTEPRYRRHLVRRGGLKEDAKKERAPWPVNCMNGGTNMRSYALQHRLTQYDLSGGVPLRYPEVRRMGENMCVCVGEGSEGLSLD